MLTFDLIAKIFMMFGLYCFNSLSGVYIYILAFAMLIVANVKERLNKKWFWIYIVFQSLYFMVLCFTFIGISSVLIVLTASIKLYSVWFLRPQKMRIVASFNALIHLTYMLCIKNWAGLLEIFPLSSNILSYLKYKKYLHK
jgi:hypothetical protein